MKARAFTPAISQRTSAGTTCARCRGLMVPSFTDSRLLEVSEQPSAPAWRCVNCGEWVDATVVMNRKLADRLDSSCSAAFSSPGQRRWKKEMAGDGRRSRRKEPAYASDKTLLYRKQAADL